MHSKIMTQQSHYLNKLLLVKHLLLPSMFTSGENGNVIYIAIVEESERTLTIIEQWIPQLQSLFPKENLFSDEAWHMINSHPLPESGRSSLRAWLF